MQNINLSFKQGLLIIVLVFGGIIGVAAWFGESSSQQEQAKKPAAEQTERARRYQAYDCAKNRITDLLKAPSTAEYQSYSDADIQGTGTSYTVRSFVDAQNSFGAMLRTEFTCSVEFLNDFKVCQTDCATQD